MALDSFKIQEQLKELSEKEDLYNKALQEIADKKKILKELDGVINTIWAYKFEFHDLEENHRKNVIESYVKKQRLLEAELEAIDLKKKL
ncbi:MAG: hypothetical protein HRU50_10265 [Winogradskyella sp.]|uniref:hypothetical protein n=1 Tax=Winogradskyella sp. TaxID=1883156 RepID=UPI0025E6DE7D|nr:hypothetical protein [Winogradskyella sp.]NRB60303.1 hypothetical protein [Winogradskyella sp.]